jgi:hypothetical protein
MSMTATVLAEKSLSGCGQCASTSEDLTFALGITALSNGADFAPKHVSVRDGRFSEVV